MIAYVVDTNVAIVANGGNTHADQKCQRQCIETLEDVCARQVVVLDDGGCIFAEYCKKLDRSGMPGVGDKFLKYVFDHMHVGKRVRLVSIAAYNHQNSRVNELCDDDDRKFLATAMAGCATILNATDSDWCKQEELTESLGVTVCQLCPQHASKQTADV